MRGLAGDGAWSKETAINISPYPVDAGQIAGTGPGNEEFDILQSIRVLRSEVERASAGETCSAAGIHCDQPTRASQTKGWRGCDSSSCHLHGIWR
jgi:hypothetical protein